MSRSEQTGTVGRLLHLLGELNARKATGRMRLLDPENGRCRSEIQLVDGQIRFATSQRKGERLGEYLVRRGVLTAELALTMLEQARNEGCRFSDLLYVSGRVPRDRLEVLLYERAEELLFDGLQNRARVEFEPESLSSTSVPVNNEMGDRLVRYRAVWPRLYQRFGDLGGRVLRVPDLSTEQLFGLSKEERTVLRLVESGPTLAQVVAGRPNRLDLLFLVERLRQAGLVVFYREHPAPETEVSGFTVVELATSAQRSVPRPSAPASELFGVAPQATRSRRSAARIESCGPPLEDQQRPGRSGAPSHGRSGSPAPPKEVEYVDPFSDFDGGAVSSSRPRLVRWLLVLFAAGLCVALIKEGGTARLAPEADEPVQVAERGTPSRGNRLIDRLESRDEQERNHGHRFRFRKHADTESPYVIVNGRKRWRKPPPGKWFTDIRPEGWEPENTTDWTQPEESFDE